MSGVDTSLHRAPEFLAGPIEQQVLFAATAVGATGSFTTPAIDLRQINAISLMFLVQAPTGAPDVKIEHAVGWNGTDFGSFDDNSDLVDSSATLPSPQGISAVALPNFLAPWVKFKVTGLAGNAAGTVIDGVLVLAKRVLT